MKSSASGAPPAPSAEMVIVGIPTVVADDPFTIASKVLQAIFVPELTSDILDIRQVTEKNSAARSQQPTACVNTKSHIVCFKSALICKHVINKKCTKSPITVREAFLIKQPGKIFVTEFLSSITYNLLRKTKAADRAWKFVWTRDGMIYASKPEGSPSIRISSEADLLHLD